MEVGAPSRTSMASAFDGEFAFILRNNAQYLRNLLCGPWLNNTLRDLFPLLMAKVV
jgi:hypothetical protein